MCSLSHHYRVRHRWGKAFFIPRCTRPCVGPSVEQLSVSHHSPCLPTSLAAEEGPRRDQTVRQPHSRRMRHAWEVTCLAHNPPAGTQALLTLELPWGSNPHSPVSLCKRELAQSQGSVRWGWQALPRGCHEAWRDCLGGALPRAWHLAGSQRLTCRKPHQPKLNLER